MNNILIAKHPKLGAKTLNEEQLRSYIRKIIFETLDEMENEDAFHEIYDIIANCVKFQPHLLYTGFWFYHC